MNRYMAMEFWGKGDPMFGGRADDRVLGKSGQFLRGCYTRDDIATFGTREQAQAAADAAPNRRADALLSILED